MKNWKWDRIVRHLAAALAAVLIAASAILPAMAEGSRPDQETQLSLIRDTYVTWVGSAVGVMPVDFGGEADPSALSYASSDDSVARVSGTAGCVIGVSEGTAVITISAPGGQTLEAKVIVYASRTDAELVQNYYEYTRAQKIAELAAEGVAVTEGVDFAGYNVIGSNFSRTIADYADEIWAEVEANGGNSPYTQPSKDALAALISVYKEDENTQIEKLTQDLAAFLKPLDEATTADALMEWNAAVIADGGKGLWKNNVNARGSRSDGTEEPGCYFILNPTLGLDFALDRQADYDGDMTALETLIGEVLRACGETDAEVSANVPKVLSALKAITREKTMTDVMMEGLSEEEMDAELERIGLYGGMFTVGEVDTSFPGIKYMQSLAGFNITEETKVQLNESGAFARLNAFADTGDADALRELIKVSVAYPYFIETKKGFEVNNAYMIPRYAGVTPDYANRALVAKYGSDAVMDYSVFLSRQLIDTYNWQTAQAYIEDRLKGQQIEADLQAMYAQIMAEYRSTFENAAWLSEEARAAAINKIEHIECNLFGPDDYTGFVTDQDLATIAEGGSFFSNLRKLNSGKWHGKSAWMGKISYGAECYWRSQYGLSTPMGECSPLFTNASYDPASNSIGIFTGIIDEEFYRSSDPIYNYSRAGAVIAHELGHAFDERGAEYDYLGAHAPWLTEADLKIIRDKQDRLAKIYSSFSVLYDPETETVSYANGAFEMPEIMADVCGDEIVISLVKKLYPGEENLRKLFQNLTLLWNTETYSAWSLEYDYHPFGGLRGLANPMMFDEFYEVFGIQPGDGMYLAPEYRVREWSESSAAPKEGSSVSYVKEEATAYLYAKDKTAAITILKDPALPGAAWIDVMDFLKYDHSDQVRFSIARSGDIYTVTKLNNGVTGEEVNAVMIIDAAADTVTFPQLEMFIIGEDAHKDPGTIIDNPYVLELQPEYAAGVTVSSAVYDLKKYGFDVVADGDAVYLPAMILSDIFGFNYNSAEYVDGSVYFVHAGEEVGPDPSSPYVDKSSLYASTTRDAKEIEFAYNAICFVMDELYGCPPHNVFSENIRALGFDRAAELDADLSHIKNDYLKSPNRIEYYVGLNYLTGIFGDFGHTSMASGLSSLYSVPMYADTELLKTWADPARVPAYPEDAEKYNALIMASEMWKMGLYQARAMAYTGNPNTVKETDDTSYVVVGDKAFFAFDSFKYMVLPELKEALDDAAANGVKDFYFDISCNGGGDERVAAFLLDLITGDGTFYYTNAKTGNAVVQKVRVDLNQDGVFDEQDDAVSYDFNYKIITSKASFSSGNLFPCLAELAGIPIYGERSGGGTCFVMIQNHTDTMAFMFSGANTFARPDSWTNVEDGAPLTEEWVTVSEDGSTDYSHLYDILANAE